MQRKDKDKRNKDEEYKKNIKVMNEMNKDRQTERKKKKGRKKERQKCNVNKLKLKNFRIDWFLSFQVFNVLDDKSCKDKTKR